MKASKASKKKFRKNLERDISIILLAVLAIAIICTGLSSPGPYGQKPSAFCSMGMFRDCKCSVNYDASAKAHMECGCTDSYNSQACK